MSLRRPFAEWNRDFSLLAAAVFSVGAFYGVQLSLYANFVVKRLALGIMGLGIMAYARVSSVAPLAGGLVWHYFGYRVIFFSGSALALVSLVVSQWVDPKAQSRTAEALPIAAGS